MDTETNALESAAASEPKRRGSKPAPTGNLARKPRDSLNRSVIIEAGLAIVKRQGLSGLTFQALGDELELGIKDPKVSSVPPIIEKTLGLFNPIMRELSHTAYQFNEPFIMSDEKSRKTFGLKPKPWEFVIRDLVAQYK